MTETRSVSSVGVTLSTVKGESSFTLDGTSTATGNFSMNIVRGAAPLVLGAGTYAVKMVGLNAETATADYAYVGKNGVGAIAQLNPNNNWQNTFTLASRSEIYLQGVFAKTTSYDNKEITVQLETGNQFSTYEPYQGVTQEINLGKNLINLSDFDITSLNNGAPYNTIRYRIANPSHAIPVKPNQSYTISTVLGDTVKGMRVGIQECALDGTFIRDNGWQQIGVNPYVYTASADCYNLKLVFSLSTTSSNVTTSGTEDTTSYQGQTPSDWLRGAKIQLEVGGVATSWAEYITPIELAKIGTYQDRIYKSGDDWYIEKNVGKITLDGTETWTSGGTFTNAPNYCVIQTTTYDSLLSTVVPALADYFTNYSASTLYAGMPAFNEARFSVGSGGNNKIRLAVPTSLLDMTDTTTQASSFDTWVTAHNVTIYYALATPSTTQITDSTLINQLEAIVQTELYTGQNNISNSTASPNLAGDFEITYQTWEKYNKHNVYIWNDAINDWQIIVGMEGES